MAGPVSTILTEQFNGSTEQRCPYLRVQAVNVYVRDLELSLRFYEDQLGFEVVFDVLIPSGQR